MRYRGGPSVTRGDDGNSNQSNREDPPYLNRLRFYRDEVKHEFNLLAMRSTTLVTCQPFLIVPFAILNTAAHFRVVAVPAILIPLLGLYTSWVIQEPIRTAHCLIAESLLKQRQLLRNVESNDDKTRRDQIVGADQDTTQDQEHVRSMAFTSQAPVAFQVFWLLALIWVEIRCIFEFGENRAGQI